MRIVSLLPSITEIVCALGCEFHLVGRSHECDFPSSVQSLPVCTAPKCQPVGTSYEIDQRVKSLVQEGLSVYRVDAKLLAALEPDLILTQDHCEACAASYAEIREAVNTELGDDVEIISVSPTNLDEILISIQQISEAIDAEKKGTELIQKIITSLNKIQVKTGNLPVPDVLCIEWMEPLMASGNWFPELVHIAGGQSLLANAGEPSPWINWEDVVDKNPDILLISPCGYSTKKTTEEMSCLTAKPGWNELRAIQSKRVFLMEGHHYFHRPGPRLVDSTEILAEIFHPGIFETKHHKSGWIKFSEL